MPARQGFVYFLLSALFFERKNSHMMCRLQTKIPATIKVAEKTGQCLFRSKTPIFKSFQQKQKKNI
jgi:hypothetical protein